MGTIEKAQLLWNCDFHNLFATFGDQIVSHNARASTLLFIMKVYSAIFKLNTPLPDRTFTYYILPVHLTQFPMNFYWFKVFCHQKTNHRPHLTTDRIAAHILNLNIKKRGSMKMFHCHSWMLTEKPSTSTRAYKCIHYWCLEEMFLTYWIALINL